MAWKTGIVAFSFNMLSTLFNWYLVYFKMSSYPVATFLVGLATALAAGFVVYQVVAYQSRL